jgi:ribA/ribD-fused uncharacterized protein
MKVTADYVFFWKGILGNWHKVPDPGILYKGIYFPTTEHVFMYQKAEFFQDFEAMEKIKNTASPKEAKDIGRQVKGYDDEAWADVREEAMFTALWLRSKVDIEFRDTVINLYSDKVNGVVPRYGTRDFVEANPHDTIWAIGMSEDDENVEKKRCWNGKNLLGKLYNNLADILCKYHKWHDSLIWCPSQCYYTFEDKSGNPRLLYLRWRHSDPWQAEVYQFNEDGSECWGDYIDLDPPFFKDTELDELKAWCLEKIKELD